MNNGNKRFLAYAVALATSFSALPGMAYAEVAPAETAAAKVAQETSAPPQAVQANTETAEDPRTAE